MWKCERCNKEKPASEEKCINCGHGKTMDYTGHRSVSRLCLEITDNWKKKKEKPMLMADCIAGDAKEVVLGSKLLRGKVHEIDFVKMNLASIPSGAWDVSDDRNRTIWAWIRETDGVITLKIGSENGVYANINCSKLFYNYSNVRKIEFSNLFDTSRTTDMGKMFWGCKNLKNLDVSNFKTGCVTNMERMFCDCANLTQLDILNFYYAPDVNTQDMFKDCGVSKDNTALDLESEPRTLLNTENSDVSKEQKHTTESLNVSPPTLPVGCYYAGDSIKEICADFLSHQKNTIFDNGRKDKKWVLCHALGIPSEEKIYLLHDASIKSLTNLLVGKIAVAKAEGFAITDKGIYMKKEYDKRKVFMSWERLKEANIDIDSLSNVRVDEIPIAFSRKDSVNRAKLQDLVYLFSSIRRFLNRRTF